MSRPDVEQAMARMDAQLATARQNAERMAEVRGRGEVEDGRVVVTVLATGALQGLELDPRAMRMPSADLAAAIVAAARAAEKDAAEQVRAIWRGTETGGIDMADAAQGRAQLSTELDRRLQEAREALRRSL